MTTTMTQTTRLLREAREAIYARHLTELDADQLGYLRQAIASITDAISSIDKAS